MQAQELLALNFYDAVISDNMLEVQKILTENVNLPMKIITGMLIIAIEEKFLQSVKAILEHKIYSRNKINDRHLDAILCLAAKSNLLAELGITRH